MNDSPKRFLRMNPLEKVLFSSFLGAIALEVVDAAPTMIEKGSNYGGYSDLSSIGKTAFYVAAVSLVGLIASVRFRAKYDKNARWSNE